MKRLVFAVLLATACDHEHEGDVADASPALSAIIPPLPMSTPTPTPLASASTRLADGGTCGPKGQPDCPLQGWMKKNMNPPLEAKDWQGIADALERDALLAPPPDAGYPNWVSISKDGANAARAAELNAVKAACRGCHDQYKNKYRAELRMRALP